MTSTLAGRPGAPRWQGLGDPHRDKAACGVGALVDLTTHASHGLVRDSLTLLQHLDHRSARGAEEGTGDGAGILLQLPHCLFQAMVPALGDQAYAVGQAFFPPDDELRRALMQMIERTATARHFELIAWREVPTDHSSLGRTALESEPVPMQFFLRPVSPLAPPAMKVQLYLLRRIFEHQATARLGAGLRAFYIASLSDETIVYKGMLTCGQLARYYRDLNDGRMTSSFALVHSRFSTNTLGAWHLAHPCRRLVHNGEFNTLRGNENWMRARQGDLQSVLFGADIDLIKPVIAADSSDTAKFDSVLDLLLVAGRSLPEALRMMIPEAWETDPLMRQDKKDFYDFQATIMEPWDGPALVVATDGSVLSAILDRNGFRPCRYCVTADERLVLASETGVLDLDERSITAKGRLGPGQMLTVDLKAGRLLTEEEVTAKLIDGRYGRWLHDQRLRLPEFQPAPTMAAATDHAHHHDHLRRYRQLFGYTQESIEYVMVPMASDGKDPIGAMGDDAPLAVLSKEPQALASYFRQLFAQVSNPPLDFIREAVVTSLRSYIGRQRNILERTPAQCHQVLLESPILTEWGFEALKNMDAKGIRALELDGTFARSGSLDQALAQLSHLAVAAIHKGFEILVVSDRKVDAERLPVPSLLAIGAIHHALIDVGLRTRVGIVMDVGDAHTVHQFCTLIGYGADAVHPWLAYETLDQLVAWGEIEKNVWDAHRRYRSAVAGGLLKVMSKMGISTLQGYKGAQVFEAIGLSETLVARCFPGTPAHLPGIELGALEHALRQRHHDAFLPHVIAKLPLPSGGALFWRRDGEAHLWNPLAIAKLQQAVRANDPEAYKAFVQGVRALDSAGHTVRGLLEFRTHERERIDIAEVESVEAILRRFSTGSMSFGALSQEAHEALATAMNRIGAKSGSGEGGEQVDRFGTDRACSMKQVASGRFGVTIHYLAAARQIEIKVAQGSKPGEGGELPGAKVDEGIAAVRFSTPGVGLISPPPHHDIYSIEDLAQLIFDLKCANPAAEVHVKLVAEAGVGTIAAGVAKARADAVLISGASGGTGASIMTSIKSAGAPWELGLAEAQQILLANNLRSRIRVRVDGGLLTGRDVCVAALLGAEEFGFGTAPLVALGCIMLRKCHCNTCSVGVATQDPRLRERFAGAPEHVINYLRFVAGEVRELMSQLGFATVDDMIGRVDKLTPRTRRGGLDLSRLLYRPDSADAPRCVRTQEHAVNGQQEHRLLAKIEPAIASATALSLGVRLTNRDRAFGALTSYRVARLRGQRPLADNTIQFLCSGHAGQSFGAFLAAGLTLHLTGDANDYVGKGLSGGQISVKPPAGVRYLAGSTVAIGNVALYGATGGELYVNGQAGERFAVRNSGALAVVEGIGDHGCEYMTGGLVVVLGDTGKNFAAGMSGGEAWVLDESGDFVLKVNHDSVRLGPLDGERDESTVRALLRNHLTVTASERARQVLARWALWAPRFIKVMPLAYAPIVGRALARGEELRPQPRPIAVPRRLTAPFTTRAGDA